MKVKVKVEFEFDLTESLGEVSSEMSDEEFSELDIGEWAKDQLEDFDFNKRVQDRMVVTTSD